MTLRKQLHEEDQDVAVSSARGRARQQPLSEEKAQQHEPWLEKQAQQHEPSSATSNISPMKKQLVVHEISGDIFAAPPNDVLVHACNCQGSWGAGIAAAFRQSYPSAFQIYTSHCSETKEAALLGSCLLIPPQAESKSQNEREKSHWIGCLFTSVNKGRKKGSRDSILQATDLAMRDLLSQIVLLNDTSQSPGDIKMVKINSGLFDVPWEQTKQVIVDIEVDSDLQPIEVMSRE